MWCGLTHLDAIPTFKNCPNTYDAPCIRVHMLGADKDSLFIYFFSSKDKNIITLEVGGEETKLFWYRSLKLPIHYSSHAKIWNIGLFLLNSHVPRNWVTHSSRVITMPRNFKKYHQASEMGHYFWSKPSYTTFASKYVVVTLNKLHYIVIDLRNTARPAQVNRKILVR